MKMRLYSIFDRKMNVYMTPFPARGDVDALRQIKASHNSPDLKGTPVALHPEDFDLVFIGDFDDEAGRISAATSPTTLGNVKAIQEG